MALIDLVNLRRHRLVWARAVLNGVSIVFTFQSSKMGDWDIFFVIKAWCYCMHLLQTWQPRSEENKQSPQHTPVLSLVN
jgi:hypothetical protein